MVSEGNFEDQNVHFKNVYCWKIYNLFVQALETGLEKQSFVRYFWHDSQRVHINIQFASVG